MIRSGLAAAGVLALLAGTAAHAEMYRYRDPETGQVKLTNIPPPWMKAGRPGPRVEVIRPPGAAASPATSARGGAPAATASLGQDRNVLSVSTQTAPWELRFPRDEWALQQTKRRADGLGDYYMFSNGRTQLNVSFFIEPATKCKSPAECRSLFWSGAGAQFPNPQGVEQLEENGFAVVRFVVQELEGVKINQLNYSAHTVRDGYWVDMRISKIFSQDADRQAISDFVKSISFAKKADGGG